ncbi:MAG: LptF/LptG family permease [Phycisphaeraceae bacterium]|nr:LptF/LptG family permease [Phycisphaeraceae bacterium]
MSILDRSIARHFVANVVMLTIILCCFVVTIDVSVNADRYIRNASKLATENGQPPSSLRTGLVTVFLVADLWWPRLIQLVTYLLGLVMAGAMGFTCSQMVRHREMVAILASGQPLSRIARPILLSACALCAGQLAVQETVLPRIAPLLTRDTGEAGGRMISATSVPLMPDGMGNVIMASSFDAGADGGAGSMTSLIVWLVGESGIKDRRITADRAVWQPNAGAWQLENGVVENRAAEEDSRLARIDRFETDLTPTAITVRRYSGYSQCLSWSQLIELEAATRDSRGADARRQLARLERLRWGRLATIATTLLALSITMPFFITREPKNMVIQSLKCAPVAIISLMGGALGSAAAIPGVPAAVSVFVPAMILTPIAIATLTSIKT